MSTNHPSTKTLIVDDDESGRTLVEAMLARWGYEVSTCSNGIEALEILEQRDGPQLTILDWMMPEMDGIELLKNSGVHHYLLHLYHHVNQHEPEERYGRSDRGRRR